MLVRLNGNSILCGSAATTTMFAARQAIEKGSILRCRRRSFARRVENRRPEEPPLPEHSLLHVHVGEKHHVRLDDRQLCDRCVLGGAITACATARQSPPTSASGLTMTTIVGERLSDVRPRPLKGASGHCAAQGDRGPVVWTQSGRWIRPSRRPRRSR